MVEYDKVVHVETLSEYLSVLDRWFDKGYDWWDISTSEHDPHPGYFNHDGVRYLTLDDGIISCSVEEVYTKTGKSMSFKEFLAREGVVTYSPISIGGIPEREQEVTYEVSEEQMAFLHKARENKYPATYLICDAEKYRALFSGYEYTEEFERDLLKYVSGDENVVFKVKGPLYLLKGKDRDGDTVYFRLNTLDAPTYVYEDYKSDAFKASHDEIVRWETPFWKAEPVDA